MRHLLCLEDAVQRSDLAVFVTSEHLAERTGGHAAGDAVNVDLLVLVVTTRRLLLLHLWGRSAARRQTGGDTHCVSDTSWLKTSLMCANDKLWGPGGAQRLI